MASYDDARLNRIRRRAQQTADRLADELIAGNTEATGADDELIAQQRLPSPEVAIPALIHVWSRSLQDDSLAAARPAIKRSMMTLLQPDYDGHGRAYGDIVGLVAQSHQLLALEAEQLEDDLTPEGQRLVLLHRGEWLQTAADAQALFRLALYDRIVAVSRILLGTAEPSSLGPEFPHLARVSPSAREFWVGLHLRLALPISIARFNFADPATHLALLPRKFYLQVAAVAAGSPALSYTSVEIQERLAARLGWGAATGEAALTAFPLIPVGQNLWATSMSLIADSLAPFMLEAIRQADQWEAAIGQPFEDEVNRFFRSRGFASGPVSAGGRWQPSGPGAEVLSIEVNRQLAMRSDLLGLSGQVDVLAIGQHGGYVIECKSISAMIRMTNTFGRMSPDDAESWRSKLLAKIEWLYARLDRGIDWGAVTVEGLQYLNEAELSAKIPVLPFALLQSVVDRALAKSES
jgi:hypothetical protein